MIEIITHRLPKGWLLGMVVDPVRLIPQALRGCCCSSREGKNTMGHTSEKEKKRWLKTQRCHRDTIERQAQKLSTEGS